MEDPEGQMQGVSKTEAGLEEGQYDSVEEGAIEDKHSAEKRWKGPRRQRSRSRSNESRSRSPRERDYLDRKRRSHGDSYRRDRDRDRYGDSERRYRDKGRDYDSGWRK